MKLVCLSCGQSNRFPDGKLGTGPKCGACGRGLTQAEPFETSLNALEKAIRIDEIALVVDFWAPWCGPCRTMAPEFAQAARTLAGQVRFAKLDTEAYPQAGHEYAIRGIPLLIAFRSGREVKRQAGAMRASDIVDWVSTAEAV